MDTSEEERKGYELKDKFNLYLSIAFITFVLMAYKLIKMEANQLDLIYYSPINSKDIIRSKVSLLLFLEFILVCYLMVSNTLSIQLSILLMLVFILYGFIGLLFSIIRERKGVVIIFWISIFVLTFLQLFFLKRLDVNKFHNILNNPMKYSILIGILSILALLFYVGIQKLFFKKMKLRRRWYD